MLLMGKKKLTDTDKDRHKPRKMVAIRSQYIKPAESLRLQLGCSDMTELANIAMRELLEKHKLWPPVLEGDHRQ
jgi:hypothetical protein